MLLVLEPTGSGLADAKRLVALAKHFEVPVLACINKATLHEGQTAIARKWIADSGLVPVGELPYHEAFRKASSEGCSIWESGGKELQTAIQLLWQNVQKAL